MDECCSLEDELANRVNHYQNELQAARRRLAEAQQHVASLEESLRVWAAALAHERVRLGRPSVEQVCEGAGEPPPEHERPLEGMSYMEAATHVLKSAQTALTPQEILERMEASGWSSDADAPLNVLRTMLYREAQKTDGKIAKTGRGQFDLASRHRGGDDEDAK